MGKIVDISHHQGNIDWSKASKEIDLAIIRVQYGSTTVDRMYKEYVEGCKKYNVPFAHYAYCRFISVEDAIKEAEDFHNRADKEALFLVADVEEKTISDASKMLPATQAFIDTLKNKGWKVGLYTGHHFYKPYNMDQVKADFLWIPRYSNTSSLIKPDYDCDLWQFTDKGKVSGIGGNVDLNELNGDKSLKWFTGETTEKVEKKVTLKEKAVVKKTTYSKNSDGTYTVKSGDTLGEIAKAFDLSLDNLAKWNNIENKNVISAGQKLKLKASSTSTNTKKHKIVSGDTLSGIAKKYNTTVDKLKSLNGLKSDVIYAGKTLKVPSTTSKKSTSSKKYHTVKSGDTVSELAVKYNTTSAKIKSWNKLNSDYTIYAGQKLRVK